MTLWVNRLYPKSRTPRETHAVTGHSGDTNFYYTLPVTQNETYLKNVQNHDVQVAGAHTETTVNHRENRVENRRNSYADTREVRNVTYQTTVQVDMVNHNQIHGEQDMHRIAEYLRDALEETLSVSAEGVM